jgi:nitroreductase
MDIFQERYLTHQERKKHLEDNTSEERIISNNYFEVLENRRSQRIFNDKPVDQDTLSAIINSGLHAPSSCNRQAVYVKYIDNDLAERLLVGGKKWINKADKVIGIFADKEAYKSPNEKDFMPYLDGGVIMQTMCLTAEYFGVGSCIVNPNIREENKCEFNDLYNPKGNYFCGAIALGRYDKKAKKSFKKESMFE